MKQQGFIKCSLLSIALSAALMGMPNPALADGAYTVQPGDSLWKIAVKHNTSIEELKKANNLASSEIIVGQQLIIPGQADQPETGTVTYTVKPGDSLFFIARDFGITVSELKSVNNLTGDEIWVGQQLIIPAANSESNALQYKEYTVVAGDSLYFISKRFNTTVDKLMEINQLASHEIYVGQVLKVPAQDGAGSSEQNTETEQEPPTQPMPKKLSWDIPKGAVLHYVQPGDCLDTIAQKYKSSPEAVIKTNRLKSDLITPEMPLFVPVNSSKPVYGIEAPQGPKKEGCGELLEWEFANWHFNHHSTGIIKDLETGKTFKAYRIGGGNHADCEPLTAEDTEVFKSLFGGQWTWLTRPVILQYEGREIAASMSGMPHAFDTIKDNNFDGMFDLHFLHSRTHKDNQESELHQQTVMKAAGY
ncbi:MAG: LysM peptidoglycan-binding domain-containing protein [Desulfotomaculum sp.]|nr:LysM peptidoglycan-binding domain-containing protein [Desulfotomaculum sp.]